MLSSCNETISSVTAFCLQVIIFQVTLAKDATPYYPPNHDLLGWMQPARCAPVCPAVEVSCVLMLRQRSSCFADAASPWRCRRRCVDHARPPGALGQPQLVEPPQRGEYAGAPQSPPARSAKIATVTLITAGYCDA